MVVKGALQPLNNTLRRPQNDIFSKAVSRLRKNGAGVAFVAALAAILVALAAVQYHWIGQVSAADRARMKLSLEASVTQFVQDLNRELQRPCMVFRADPRIMATRDWDRYAERYEEWMRTAPDPELLANVYLWDLEGRSRLLRLNPATRRWYTVDRPAHLEPVFQDFKAEDPGGFRRRPWVVHESIPALAHAQVHVTPPAREGDPPNATVVGLLVLELRSDYLWNKLLPELVARHLAAGSFDAAVVQGAHVLYRSRTGMTDRGPADARAELVAAGPPEGGKFPLQSDTRDGGWTLVVRHRGGSLDAVVDGLRARNLAVSFGVLLLLAVAMATVIASTRRAQRLARLQMDFVAGVSHEFRTPLAVICSAGDNLAEGVVDANPRVKQYGALVRDQGRRLREMVEQILSFAAGDGGRQLELRPVVVPEVVESALADCRALLAESGFVVDKRIDPELPEAIADEAALKQCLQNLIGNGIKYGGDKGWIGIAARADGEEVRITVEDHGLGIEPADLPYIFDPFYRGQAARAAQIHGTGLGLSLTKNIVEAMGGRISVQSAPGKGSTFTLHLRVSRDGHE